MEFPIQQNIFFNFIILLIYFPLIILASLREERVDKEIMDGAEWNIIAYRQVLIIISYIWKFEINQISIN